MRQIEQAYLWESWIELGEKFDDAVTLSSVPVDLRALRALKRSPLALDLYAWLTYTAFVATKARKPRTVPREALHAQMGAEWMLMGGREGGGRHRGRAGLGVACSPGLGRVL